MNSNKCLQHASGPMHSMPLQDTTHYLVVNRKATTLPLSFYGMQPLNEVLEIRCRTCQCYGPPLIVKQAFAQGPPCRLK